MRSLPILAGLVLAPSLASADPVRATYELSWYGIEVAIVEAELSETGTSYRLEWRGQTSGFVGALYPFASEAISEGDRADTGLQPRLHFGESLRGDEARAWTVGFDPDGRAVRIEIPEDDRQDRDPVPSEMQVGPDPLSLALLALDRVRPGFRQTGTAFDGRRVYQVSAACADTPEVLPDAGETLLCKVDGHLVAGASRRWRERGQPREERPPAEIWLGRNVVTEGWWPVRVQAETRWGTVTARLISTGAAPPAG